MTIVSSQLGDASTYRPRILLKPDTVAFKLGVSRGTVYEMARSGRLPTTKWHGNLRIPSDLLDDWIEEHTWFPKEDA